MRKETNNFASYNPIKTHDFKTGSCQKCMFRFNIDDCILRLACFKFKKMPVSSFGLGLTATTASPMAGYGRGHSIFLKLAMGAEF